MAFHLKASEVGGGVQRSLRKRRPSRDVESFTNKVRQRFYLKNIGLSMTEIVSTMGRQWPCFKLLAYVRLVWKELIHPRFVFCMYYYCVVRKYVVVFFIG